MNKNDVIDDPIIFGFKVVSALAELNAKVGILLTRIEYLEQKLNEGNTVNEHNKN